MGDNGTDKKTLQDGIMNKKKTNRKTVILICCFMLFLSALMTENSGAEVSVDGPMSLGFTLGGEGESNLELCPEGASVIGMFMYAWKKGDYEAMYKLLDDDSKKDYPFEQAKFDFRMIPFTEYKLSSIRKKGENFEFMLSTGDWQSGDRELVKMIISGKTFKIMMPTKHSPFKESAASYY